MGSRGWARIIAGAVLVGAIAAVLAVVSSGRAGNPGALQFEVRANPQFLTVSNQGFVVVRFSPPAGGSSTHVVFTIKVFNALAPVATSGCSVTLLADELDRRIFTCNIGTVNGGQVVKRYLLITAPAAAVARTIDASVASDNGSGGKKGGGGGAAETVSDDDLLTVVSSGNTTRAGTCTGLASTPSVTADDLVSTSISGGSPSLDIPCPWGFVGENGPSGKSRTGVSFFGFPLTEATDPVTWVITFYSLPAPFHTLSVYFDPNYTGSGPFQAPNTPLARCVTAPAPPAPACLDSLVKDGKGAIATIIAQGTDGDPGAGMG